MSNWFRYPENSYRPNTPGFATLVCTVKTETGRECGYRAQRRTSPNALPAWQKVKAAMRQHQRERHAAATPPAKDTKP